MKGIWKYNMDRDPIPLDIEVKEDVLIEKQYHVELYDVDTITLSRWIVVGFHNNLTDAYSNYHKRRKALPEYLHRIVCIETLVQGKEFQDVGIVKYLPDNHSQEESQMDAIVDKEIEKWTRRSESLKCRIDECDDSVSVDHDLCEYVEVSDSKVKWIIHVKLGRKTANAVVSSVIDVWKFAVEFPISAYIDVGFYSIPKMYTEARVVINFDKEAFKRHIAD